MHGFVGSGNCRDFFRMIDSCEREVELHTKNGFSLNLKSTLCQYVAWVEVFAKRSVQECELVTHCEADAMRILGYFYSLNIETGAK